MQRTTSLLLLLIVHAACLPAFGEGDPQCGTIARPAVVPAVALTGGYAMPARGVVRILLVFASFPDDSTPHPYWPAHQPPTGLQEFLDPDTTRHSTGSHNLTHYFRQMSLGALQVIGDVHWVESARSQEEYRNGAYGRANTDLLVERVDALVDFSRYDAWSAPAPFEVVTHPDTVVDMIVMVWRTNMFEYLGEASLGYKPAFTLDGTRIEMGYPGRYDYPRGSGVTCEYPYNDSPVEAMRTMVHELGHWLLGAPHPYNTFADYGKHEYWGMLCTSHQVSSCANAYERERLGWISVPEILPGSSAVLRDFLLTGDARKYHPPQGEDGEFFYLENHQRLSSFDDVSADTTDRGLWILHQNGPYMEMDNLRIVASDGNWTWDNPGTTSACYGQSLPIFARGVPAVVTGSSHRDMLSTATSAVEWMFVNRDRWGQPRCGKFFAGEGFRGAFSPDSMALFSPYTNPSSATWTGTPGTFALGITGATDGALLITSFDPPLAAPPARRFLGQDPRTERKPGRVVLAWGPEWVLGQPVEPDVAAFELEQKMGPDGAWTRVYQGPLTTWTDTSLPYDSSGTLAVHYRVRVRDSSALYSPWSNVLTTLVTQPVGVAGGPALPLKTGLDPAFPNPFNGNSNFGFRISESARAELEVLDILGRPVRLLAEGGYGPGRYAVTWDGRDARGNTVGSGVYLVRLRVGNHLFTQRVLYLR